MFLHSMVVEPILEIGLQFKWDPLKWEGIIAEGRYFLLGLGERSLVLCVVSKK